MAGKLSVGIIGGGFGTTGLLPAFKSIPGCTVVGVCAHRSGWKEFLQRTDLDAVAIAVPPAAQYAITKLAITKGLHVFAEKPLAANVAQAKELLTLAKKRRIVHGIDFIFPEINAWQKVKEMLDKETFGALKHVSVNWDWQSGEDRFDKKTWRSDLKQGGGALAFYFSHGLHYLEFFAGRIKNAKAIFAYSSKVTWAKDRGETGFDVLLSFKNGVTGYAHVSSIVPGYVRHQLIFQCETGVIALETENAVVDHFTVTTYSHAGTKRIKVAEDKGRPGEDERVKSVRKLAKRFIDACAKGAPKEMRPSFEDGVRVQELIEEIRTKK